MESLANTKGTPLVEFEQFFEGNKPITRGVIHRIMLLDMKIELFEDEVIDFLYCLKDGARFNCTRVNGDIYLIKVSTVSPNLQRVHIKKVSDPISIPE